MRNDLRYFPRIVAALNFNISRILGERLAEVMDAAVLGIPHRVLGEEVGAAVQLRPGAAVSETDLREHVADHLAAFKVPVRVVFRDEPLPRNANGKILKRRLKQELGWS